MEALGVPFPEGRNSVKCSRRPRLLIPLLALLAISPTLALGTAPYRVGERVLVKFYSVTNEATVLGVQGDRYRVRYEGQDAPDARVGAGDLLPYDPGQTRGGLPPGVWQCWLPIYEHTYMGSFKITARGQYRFLTGKKGAGRYRYDEATRTLTWLSGDLTGRGITGEYTNTARNGPIVQLIFPKGRRVGDVQNCLRR